MRVIGWCTRCHRIRQVRVVRWVGTRAFGYCQDCDR